MKKALLAMVFVAVGSLMAAPHVTIGIGIGVPGAAVIARPVCPGPGYNWVDGYYGPNGVWVAGYWAAPVVRVAPHYAPRVVVPAGRYGAHRGFRR